jgi:hypothetical protein
MRTLLVLAAVAFAASFALPVFHDDRVLRELMAARDEAEGLGRRIRGVLEQLPRSGVRALEGLSAERAPPAQSFRGIDAARESLRLAVERVKDPDASIAAKAEAMFVCLASPLFLVGLLAALARARRAAALLLLVGLASASYWLVSGRVEARELAAGYWVWTAAFPLALAGLVGRRA